jgi:hypothetical protein
MHRPDVSIVSGLSFYPTYGGMPMRRRISYANVAATLALVFSMSGGALAATHYLINSTGQINPKVLKKLKGKPGKIGAIGATGATGAIGATGGTGAPGAAGKEGAPGKEGAKGEQGSPGVSGYEVVEGNVAKGSGSGFNLAISIAKCPAGKSILGGGFKVLTGEDTKIFVADNAPNNSSEWEARLTSGSVSSYTEAAYVICGKVTT